jgi:RHO1 GDP-GTP exchange protein 1/2
VDKHGNPCRSTSLIEWDGTAEHVAMSSPYILLFNRRFVEIRHVETGHLAQIIPGGEIHCLWDGRGGDFSMASQVPGHPQDHIPQEKEIHAVMNTVEVAVHPGSGIRPPAAVMQYIFKLTPAYPLPGPELENYG